MCVETRVGDATTFGGGEVETVPAVPLAPAAGRTAGSSRRPSGYVLRSAQESVYFAGDTDLFDEMAELSPSTWRCCRSADGADARAPGISIRSGRRRRPS